MKIATLSAAVSLALAFIALPATANDGIINFDGLVTDITCSIEGTPPGGGAVVKNVNLAGVPAIKLDAAGKRGNLTAFAIRVGGAGESGCTNGRSAMIAFDPTSAAIDAASGRLNNDAGDEFAKNVQVEVTSRTGAPINVLTEKSEPVVIVNNQALLQLAAQYYATAPVEHGKVATRVGFMVEYAE